MQATFDFEAVAAPAVPVAAGSAPAGPPTIASVDDIGADLARGAFRLTSFDPDRRGDLYRRDYAAAVNRLYAELWPLARTDAQRAVLADQMARFRDGYIRHLSAYLASHAHVASPMITGPAKFPVARNEKRGRAADNKLAELIAWDARARAAIRKAVLASRTDDEKQGAEWAALRRRIAGCLETIGKIDAGAEFYDRSAFVNSIAGRVERLAAAGAVDLVDRALAFVGDHNARVDKPAITPRHRFWTFGDLARQAAERSQTEATQAEAVGPTTLASGSGVEVLANPAADRVQIVYPSKPDRDTIGRLKSAGWNWSPSAGTWQRKLTDNARRSALEITGLAPTA